jgi:hypothetical protein
VQFDAAVGTGTNGNLGDLDITGALDLNAAIGSGATAGAATISVSTTSNIGANVTTSGTQTYTGAVTLSDDLTLRGTTIYAQSTLAGTGNASSVSTTGVTGWVDSNGDAYAGSYSQTWDSGGDDEQTILGYFNSATILFIIQNKLT